MAEAVDCVEPDGGHVEDMLQPVHVGHVASKGSVLSEVV